MGEVPEPSLQANEIEDAHDLALAIIPTLKGLATGHNSMCKDVKHIRKQVKDVDDTAKKADQRSKTNRWLIGIIISVAGMLFIGVIVAGITV